MVHVARVAIAIACVLGFVPGAAGAADLPTVRVAKASAVGIPFMPIEIGQEQGIWKAVGINVESVALRGDSQVQQALTAGDIDMSLSSGPGLGFVAKGVPAIAVGALTGSPNAFALIAGAKSNIKTIADLKGQHIGITNAGSLTDWLIRQLAIKQGWAQNAIPTVALGDTKGAAAALSTGAIDGACGASEFAFDLEDRNQGRVLLTFGSVVPQFLTQVISARNDFVAQHPDLVQKFLLGWYRSVAYMKAHRAYSIALAVKQTGLTEHALSKTFEAAMPIMSNDGTMSPSAVDRLAKSFVELGILEETPDMNKLITRRFVPVKI